MCACSSSQPFPRQLSYPIQFGTRFHLQNELGIWLGSATFLYFNENLVQVLQTLARVLNYLHTLNLTSRNQISISKFDEDCIRLQIYLKSIQFQGFQNQLIHKKMLPFVLPHQHKLCILEDLHRMGVLLVSHFLILDDIQYLSTLIHENGG